ncbi:MAG TPA: PA14 domain-containing protein [Verrucomicrobiae bacterium]|nr:PA14 domain-containing protein [Verrucomicrobiae bacterium]
MKFTPFFLTGFLVAGVFSARAEDKLEPGLVGEYFQLESGLQDFPDLGASRKPDLQRVDKDINFASTTEAFPGTKMVDNFYIRWTGRLRVGKAGAYTFTLESDDGSRLFIDGKQVVDNGGTHSMEEKSEKVTLTAGDHDLKVEFFESEEDAGCILSWEADGLKKETVPAGVLFHAVKGDGPGAAADNGKPGLLAEYYSLGESMDDFPTLKSGDKPKVTRVDNQINFESTQDAWPGTDLVDYFYARWTGKINIPKAGEYTFFLESDDGSRMSIDGKQIIDNGGVHGMEEKDANITLTAGPHAIKVEFFENDVDAGCKLSWRGPDLSKEIVPAKVLTH